MTSAERQRRFLNAQLYLSATPTAAASIRSRTRWPNRAAERSLSPILLKLDAFAQQRRIPSSMFFTALTRAPRPSLQSSEHAIYETSPGKWFGSFTLIDGVLIDFADGGNTSLNQVLDGR